MAYYKARLKNNFVSLGLELPADTDIIVQYSVDAADHVFGNYYNLTAFLSGEDYLKPAVETVIELDNFDMLEEITELPEIIPLAIVTPVPTPNRAEEPLHRLRF
jgi:hypothetical protein